jgi:hypothetical protein
MAGFIAIDLDSEIVSDLRNTSTGNITIYPNPTTDYLYLGKSFPEGVTVSIYNLLGKLVGNIHVVGNRLNVQDLPKGSYLLKSSAFGSVKFLKM